MTGVQQPRAAHRRKGRGEQPMVPDAEFTSYYGRPIVKPSPWGPDIPAYLFLGGLAGGSSLLAAGADLSDRPKLRRTARFGALGALTLSFAALVHDLGRPSRFVNMLRTAKPTSPMSVGTWLLSAYGPAAGAAAASELSGLLPLPLRKPVEALGRTAGLSAAAIGPAVASYTAVLISDTATPTWNAGRREMPFVFVSSAAIAAGGWGMLTAPCDELGPARRLAIGGAAMEIATETLMEQRMGIAAEPMHTGRAGVLTRTAKVLTGLGAATAIVSTRSRLAARVSGLALLTASALTRFGIFEAGQASAQDPRYTVVPQAERVAARETRTTTG